MDPEPLDTHSTLKKFIKGCSPPRARLIQVDAIEAIKNPSNITCVTPLPSAGVEQAQHCLHSCADSWQEEWDEVHPDLVCLTIPVVEIMAFMHQHECNTNSKMLANQVKQKAKKRSHEDVSSRHNVKPRPTGNQSPRSGSKDEDACPVRPEKGRDWGDCDSNT